MSNEPKHLEVVETSQEQVNIPKPSGGGFLEQFRSKRSDTVGVEPLLKQLPHYKIAAADDFVRLHPDEENYWSWELCFVSVPILGQKRDTLHFILDDLATQHLPAKRIQRFRLALASKPDNVFFLCHVPSRNLDNQFNATALRACQEAKQTWIQVTSQLEKGIEDYEITPARSEKAFAAPKWPSQSLDELVQATFTGRAIVTPDSPALLRLVGDEQSLR